MSIDLSKVAKEKGIEYFLVSFVDLFGNLRAKLAPARAIKDMQKEDRLVIKSEVFIMHRLPWQIWLYPNGYRDSDEECVLILH